MFLGREKELESLKRLLDKQVASLVACRGRRRIGKSTLFKEFARREKLGFISIEGLGPRKGQTNADQLKNFGVRLAEQTRGRLVIPQTWSEAFDLLAKRIPKRGRQLVLLDEISWMGKHDPDFAGYLKNGWDDALKQRDNLILVVCGSVSSWVKRNLLDSATFGGRFSRDLVLKELPLRQCAEFWRDRREDLASRELLDVLSVTGGVPRYLEEVNPELSAAENIRLMCFTSDGPLFKDFSAMFSEVFGETSVMKGDVLRTLADGPKTLNEIAMALGVERGGSLGNVLDELAEAGFVAKDTVLNPRTWTKSRISYYRLCDNYARFYLKFIEPHVDAIKGGRFEFETLAELPGWQTVMGLQFENLVLNRVMDFREPLHLNGLSVRSAAPYRVSGKNGVQVDLLIQTDEVLYVVEVKRRKQIKAEIVDEVREKIRKIRHPKTISVRKALVFDGELPVSVRRCGYFDALVDVGQMIKGERHA